MSELLRLDATATALIAHDVATVADAEMDAPTPCADWTVAPCSAVIPTGSAAATVVTSAAGGGSAGREAQDAVVAGAGVAAAVGVGGGEPQGAVRGHRDGAQAAVGVAE